jgi:hypothetical protein
MALGKPFRISTLLGANKCSVLLKHRNKEDALLFDSNVVAQLCKSNTTHLHLYKVVCEEFIYIVILHGFVAAPEVAVIRKLYTDVVESYYGCLGVLQFFPGMSHSENVLVEH